MDAEIDGDWPSAGTDAIQLALKATFHDTTVTVPSGSSAKVKRLEVPIEIHGPLRDPSIKVDSKALAEALVKAGADQLAGEVRSRAEAEIGKVVDETTDKLKERLEEEAKKRLGEEAKKEIEEKIGEDLGEEIKKKAGSILDRLGGGKKDD